MAVSPGVIGQRVVPRQPTTLIIFFEVWAQIVQEPCTVLDGVYVTLVGKLSARAIPQDRSSGSTAGKLLAA
jgi:hypothetical protein